MKLEWSDEALADLDRFVEFLNRHHPSLAAIVAREIVSKAKILTDHHDWGAPSRVGRNIVRSCCKSLAPLMCFNIASMADAW
jgi:plasmid stabilization system protein ParE